MTSEAAVEEYGADSIRALEGLEAVRMRPGMYIGNTDKGGLHHLIWEVVDNSVDEVMGGFADLVSLTINEDNSITVADNGRGIPIEPQKSGSYAGMPTVEMVMTVLHAGGKFGDGAYAFSGGLHGVGISVVNALSEWVRVDIQRDGQNHHIEFAAVDEVVNGVQRVRPGITSSPLTSSGRIAKDRTGTSTTFLPDERVFSTTEWDYDLISRRLRQSAYLYPGLTFDLTDNRPGQEKATVRYHFPNGLIDFMEEITQRKMRAADNASDENFDKAFRAKLLPANSPIMLSGNDGEGTGEWVTCFRWFPDTQYSVHSFVNGVETKWGGTHVRGYESVLTLLMNRYARQDHINLLGAKDTNLEASDIRSGLNMIVSVKVKEPHFVGQTKDELSNQETYQMVRSGFSEQLWNWMQDNPVEVKEVLEKAITEMRLRKRIADAADAERAKEEKRGTAARALPLPDKLVDCVKHKTEDTELFIVEGDSAAGPAKRVRNRDNQAVFAIRGKILNIERADADRIANNKEVQGMIAALGAGSQDMFDLASSRYGKVIIMTDADDDGKHIQCLLMTLFLWFMRPLVEDGRLYIARPPLFVVDLGKQGKRYAHTYAERDELLEQYPNALTTRFKGLGEMEDAELKVTTIDPETRSLARVTIEDIEEAIVTVSDLMGGDSTPKWNLLAEQEFDLAEAISA